MNHFLRNISFFTIVLISGMQGNAFAGETLVGIPFDAPVVQQNETDAASSFDKSNIIGNFTVLCQTPELPTGCEITSLSMLLNYYGFPADKCELSDQYLMKGEVGTVDFRQAFEGDPRDPDSYGCYAPVIVATANRYLSEMQSDYMAVDLTGTELDDVLTYLDREDPVIVWGTLDCAPGHYSETWYVGSDALTWFTPEHCMVLVNYDDDFIWEADPMYGEIRQYDRSLFRERYNDLQKQAVILTE